MKRGSNQAREPTKKPTVKGKGVVAATAAFRHAPAAHRTPKPVGSCLPRAKLTQTPSTAPDSMPGKELITRAEGERQAWRC